MKNLPVLHRALERQIYTIFLFKPKKGLFYIHLSPNFSEIMRNFFFYAFLPLFVTVKFSNGQTKGVINNTAPSSKSFEYTIHWQGIKTQHSSETETYSYLSFEGAEYNHSDNYLPRYNQKIAVSPITTSFSATISDATFEPLTDAEAAFIKDPKLIKPNIPVNTSVAYNKKQPYGRIDLLPIRKNPSTGKYEKLTAFDLQIISSQEEKSQQKAPFTYASSSVLENGIWYKIAVSNSGIHKINYSFLENLGIDMSSLNPQNIRIYGTGGMQPELNSLPKIDDLTENAIYVQGESDGVFNTSDYVLFYAKGSDTWIHDTTGGCATFRHQKHLYSDTAFYFLNIDLGAGKRIQSQASSTLPATHTVSSFNDYAFHESDNVNFLKSGRLWVGEYFDNIASYNFSFSFPNVDFGSSASVTTSIASRYIAPASSNASYVVVSQSGTTTINIPSTSGGAYDVYANIGTACYTFNPSNPVITVNITKQTASAVAWLDYLEINVRRNLIMSGAQMEFRDVNSVGTGNVADFNITSSTAIQIWDITDIANATSQVLTATGINYQFRQPADTLREYVAFTGSTFYTPASGRKIPNQNLHALTNKQYIIVTHPNFYQQALDLGNYRQNKDTLNTAVVTTEQVYNEFSSGAVDAAAIRNFMKMFYDRAATSAEMPKYLLLYGDGSYDNKGNFTSNTNFIPTYQSTTSTILTTSYVSDDFYGLLDNNEGLWISDAVDIGIGRFPVKSSSEAKAMNEKIYYYERTGFALSNSQTACTSTNTSTPFGDWRNMIAFVADDEDAALHVNQADSISRIVKRLYKNYNVDKIFLDAYIQEATPGGKRYTAANDAIDKRVQKGCLIMNYTGHGGELGWAHERILENSTINSWKNINNMPLFFTATCEFSRWDDPERTSAGEYVFLNTEGGGIALMSTVRVVYAGPNFNLNLHYFNNAFTPLSNGKMPTLGDVYEYMKNQYDGYIVNGRNFTLIGDPALRIAYPKYKVSTDTVNSVPVTTSSSDTLRALSLVTVSGFVRDNSGNILTNYNGILYPTVFDKPQKITTLSNDGVTASPPVNFYLQKNVLYKGKVNVTNGYFKFSFVVPKDIAYQYGAGKISYYSENGTDDANGYYENIIVGGTNSSAPADNQGPEISLYLNDDKFVYGGITDENPDLFAKLKDVNGINTVGNGIGHDITAVLDENTANSIVLNDYYQADLNSYQSGTIRYPFNNLSEGKHTLSLKVWDVYNNSSKSFTDFVVAKSAEMALSHVLNYPNPFTTKTQFYFEHNQCCQMLEVELQIFTISGKLVKTITEFVNAEGNRSDPITWDGRDDFGDKIGRGVYIYKLKVKSKDGGTAEKLEKLVILN